MPARHVVIDLGIVLLCSSNKTNVTSMTHKRNAAAARRARVRALIQALRVAKGMKTGASRFSESKVELVSGQSVGENGPGSEGKRGSGEGEVSSASDGSCEAGRQ